MAKIIKFNENELTNLVSKIINEQIMSSEKEWNTLKNLLIKLHGYRQVNTKEEIQRKFSKYYSNEYDYELDFDVLNNLSTQKYIIYPYIPEFEELPNKDFPYSWFINSQDSLDKNFVGVYNNKGKTIKKFRVNDTSIFNSIK